jgi:hypothetical protein
MECYNDIKQIIPNIFISNNKNVKTCENILSYLNIKYLININDTFDTKLATSYNIIINSNIDFYDNDELIKIDFEQTNDFIINSLKNNSNILISDINYNISLLIIGAFLLKYINLSYTETIYWLVKKNNLQNLPKNIYYQLFLYFKQINN